MKWSDSKWLIPLLAASNNAQLSNTVEAQDQSWRIVYGPTYDFLYILKDSDQTVKLSSSNPLSAGDDESINYYPEFQKITPEQVNQAFRQPLLTNNYTLNTEFLEKSTNLPTKIIENGLNCKGLIAKQIEKQMTGINYVCNADGTLNFGIFNQIFNQATLFDSHGLNIPFVNAFLNEKVGNMTNGVISMKQMDKPEPLKEAVKVIETAENIRKTYLQNTQEQMNKFEDNLIEMKTGEIEFDTIEIMDNANSNASLLAEIDKLKAELEAERNKSICIPKKKVDSVEAEINEQHDFLMQSENRNGIGKFMGRVNHIALIVSDVGKSTTFYSKVLGLPQIKRPNFDRHGAWFTFGNVELHLIKGNPVVHDGNNLIVGHISVESNEIHKVRGELDRLKIPYEQNVSVPSTEKKIKASRTISSDSKKMAMGAVTQFFFRDPDGYYIELCNCDVLTKFCFSKSDFTMDYVEGIKNPLKTIAQGIATMVNWKKKVSGDDTGTDYGEVFKLFDKDGSGIIGITEVKNFMREMGQTDFTQLEKIFKEIDDDGSGGITEKEFKKLFDAPITRKDFEDAFRLFDKDASGFLSAAELRHVMTNMDKNLTDEEIDEMINLADVDGDGQISMDEFLKIFDKKQDMENVEVKEADPLILANLEKRMMIYGDILQNIRSREEITELLIRFKNQVPPLIGYLEKTFEDNRTFVPPAYLKADGSKFVPTAIDVDLPTATVTNPK